MQGRVSKAFQEAETKMVQVAQDYPLDWPCTCGHLNSDHAAPPFQDRVSRVCSIREETEPNPYVDECFSFDPISNLEYLEMKHASTIS